MPRHRPFVRRTVSQGGQRGGQQQDPRNDRQGYQRGTGGRYSGGGVHKNYKRGQGPAKMLDTRVIRKVVADGGSEDPGATQEAWFKVAVIFGSRYERSWVLEALQTALGRAFTAFMWRQEHRNVFFYVHEKRGLAMQFQTAAGRVQTPDGQKFVVTVTQVREPVVPELGEEAKGALRGVLARRYLPASGTLDLSGLKSDAELFGAGLYLPVHKPAVVTAVTELLAQSAPIGALNLSDNGLEGLLILAPLLNLFSASLTTLDLSLNRMKTLEDLQPLSACKQLKNLRLESNPLLRNKRPGLHASLKALCPLLERLNDAPLQLGGSSGAPGGTVVPARTMGFFPSSDVQQQLLNFIKDFLGVMDSGDRKPLLSLYTENATLTITSAQPDVCTRHRGLGPYMEQNRNLFLNKAAPRPQEGPLQAVSALDRLPASQHVLPSLSVDVGGTWEKAALVFITGLFVELGPKPSSSEQRRDKALRNFSRTLVLVPGEAGMKIQADDLYVTHAGPQSAGWFAKTAEPSTSSSAPAAAPVLVPDAVKESLTQQFALKSGLKPHFASKCLEDFNWDFEEAARQFLRLKEAGQIPAEAFQ